MLMTERNEVATPLLTLGAASGIGPATAIAGSIDVREATLTPCRNVLRSILDVIVRSNHRLMKNSGRLITRLVLILPQAASSTLVCHFPEPI
jgi:hypothetical protein